MKLYQEKRLNLNVLCCWLVALYPVLFRYESPISQLTLSEFFMIIFWGLAWVNNLKTRRIKICGEIIPLIIYLAFQVLIIITKDIGSLETVDAVGTTFRLAFLYLTISTVIYQYVSVDVLQEKIHIVAIVLSVYGLLQTAFAMVGIYLSTYIPFLPIIGTNIDEEIYKKAQMGLTYRCSSFLTEPAALGTYLTLALALALFREKDNKIHGKSVLYTVCLLVSRSSTAIIMVAFLWVIKYTSVRKINKKVMLNIALATCAAVPIAIALLIKTGIWEFFINRTFSGGIIGNSRLYALDTALEVFQSPGKALFGNGLVTLSQYLPGFPRTLYCLGMVGLICFAWIYFRAYQKGTRFSNIILLTFIILNVGTEIMLGNFSMIYMAFFINKSSRFPKGIE